MNITIIGAGLACYNLVKSLRKRKFNSQIRVICGCDGAQYYKPKLSTGFSNAMLPRDHVSEHPEVWAEKLNVELVSNTWVGSIDAEVKMLRTDKGDFAYDQLVLAYGARPRALTADIDAFNVMDDVNSLQSYQRFFDRVQTQEGEPLIIGGGLVGCELASDLANAGIATTLVSSGAFPMQHLFPAEFSEFLKAKLQQAGVQFIDQQRVVAIATETDGIKVKLSSGDSRCTAVVVNCAGLTVNNELAASAGIATDVGVLTDSLLQTNIKDIYALGDCAQINGQCHQYIAPILISTRALAATLTGKKTPVQLSCYPVEVKIQQSPTRFMIKEEPDLWRCQRLGDGIVAKGFRDGKLSAFAVSGDAMSELNQLVTELMIL